MPEEVTLDLNQIRPSEIERLLTIAGAAQGFLLHDLNGSLVIVRGYAEILEHTLAKSASTWDVPEIREFVRDIITSARDLARGFHHLTLGSSSAQWSLVSYLPKIAELIATDLAPLNVELLPNTPPPQVHVLFPQNALYAIAYELSRNAAIHAAISPIALDWSIQENMLLISVHDSGSNLKHLLSDKFTVLELAAQQLFKKGGGLSIVRRIANCSGGLLLARRSKLLGGTEIAVRIPVDIYSTGGVS